MYRKRSKQGTNTRRKSQNSFLAVCKACQVGDDKTGVERQNPGEFRIQDLLQKLPAVGADEGSELVVEVGLDELVLLPAVELLLVEGRFDLTGLKEIRVAWVTTSTVILLLLL